MKMGWLARQDGYDPNAFDVPGEQTYDPRFNQTWPAQLAQDAMGAVLAPGRALQSTEPITTEQMIKPAADLAGLVTGGSYAAPAQRGASGAGIRAYHSSPHDFDKFDLSKIGTGEGAQVYGHGLYFAESPAVSGQGGQYWQQFTRKFEGPEYLAADKLKKSGFDRDVATASAQWEVRELEDQLKRGVPPPGLQGGPFDEHILRSITKNMLYEKQAELDLLRSNRPVGPRTYEVNINADPAHMLDWDKALREQPKVIEKLVGGSKHPEDWVPNPDVTGARYWGTTQGAPHHRSDFMRERGIPGIKYLDQGSRGATNIPQLEAAISGLQQRLQMMTPSQRALMADTHADNLARWQAELAHAKANPPTSNYVVFDPGIIDIMKKYGLAGATAVPVMGSLASEGNYQTEEKY